MKFKIEKIIVNKRDSWNSCDILFTIEVNFVYIKLISYTS